MTAIKMIINFVFFHHMVLYIAQVEQRDGHEREVGEQKKVKRCGMLFKYKSSNDKKVTTNLECGTPLLERKRLLVQVVCLVNKKLNALASFQYSL